MVDPHDTLSPRTLMHGLGAVALTLLTFGLGPAVGLTASQLPMVEVVEGPIQGAPSGTMDLASFTLTLDDVGLSAPATEEAPAADEAPVEAKDVAVADPLPLLEDPALPAEPVAVAAPQKAPRPVTPPVEAAPSVWELARTGQRPTTRPKGKRCEVDRDNPKIERDQKGAFTVDRSLVNWYITHLGELNRLGWSHKHKGADGRSVGMRIGGVSCGNDLHLAGIRSGDVVHRVNGHEVRSIPQAIMVYRKVRKDPSIRVELTRRGKPVTLTYRMT